MSSVKLKDVNKETVQGVQGAQSGTRPVQGEENGVRDSEELKVMNKRFTEGIEMGRFSLVSKWVAAEGEQGRVEAQRTHSTRRSSRGGGQARHGWWRP